ncbi:hypothetical protein [Novipirellula artificiosorum]|uniref:Uncharacterized protein n=1 Tax=Novipirellula artificiosorum TaxID=2528016 RepID=A0A5C6DMJ2_9BACT|nr:hypothetical protein [Novipirellula artificiosorum]TWU37364.1 hypothetical protein Poly41_34940 [Novipirellula artificiosorum]
MATDTDLKSTVPTMGAEGGYLVEEPIAPFRVSGFLCLLLGLLSVLAIVGYPMIALPLMAIAFGMFALRHWSGPRPVGITPAKIGMVLAVVFGSCGLFVHSLKARTLGNQAEYFAREYLEIVGNGEFNIAKELNKTAVNRLPVHMPLKEHYEAMEAKMSADEVSERFEQTGMHPTVAAMGKGIQWELAKPVRIYNHYGTTKADVIMTNANDPKPTQVFLIMDYEIDSEGRGQWRVEQFNPVMKRLVAERVL